MKIGIIVGTNDPEIAWNAFRFGIVSLKANHVVNLFLINKGVEAEGIQDTRYDVRGKMNLFVENGGHILACGTCLKSRNKSGNPVCPISSMSDLLKIVEESDKLLSFG